MMRHLVRKNLSTEEALIMKVVNSMVVYALEKHAMELQKRIDLLKRSEISYKI